MRTKFCSVAPKFFGGPQYGNYFMSFLGTYNFCVDPVFLGKFHTALHLIVLIQLMKDCKRQWSANSNRFYPNPILTCQWCNLPSLTRLCGPCNISVTVPSSAEGVLQNTPVQRLKSGNPTTGLPSGMLATRPRELSSTFKQAKQVYQDLTNDGWWWCWWWCNI
jgi:hypothetical protein